MTSQLIEGVIHGTMLGAVIYLVSARHALRMAAVGLVITGLLYVLFAVLGGGNGALIIESLSAVVMAAFAVVGLVRRSPAILALGWALHPIWDLLHTGGLGSYTPDGYVAYCAALDFVVAGFIMLAAARNQARLRAGMA